MFVAAGRRTQGNLLRVDQSTGTPNPSDGSLMVTQERGAHTDADDLIALVIEVLVRELFRSDRCYT